MFAILYETGTTGFYLGFDNDFESAEKRFSEISDNLIKEITNNSSRKFDKFFEMYGVFNIGKFCNDCKCYKISTHKNQILKYELLFQMVDFCLYVVEINTPFDQRLLKRKQNYFYSGKSQYLEGSIELILN